jgi:hypothetical protein
VSKLCTGLVFGVGLLVFWLFSSLPKACLRPRIVGASRWWDRDLVPVVDLGCRSDVVVVEVGEHHAVEIGTRGSESDDRSRECRARTPNLVHDRLIRVRSPHKPPWHDLPSTRGQRHVRTLLWGDDRVPETTFVHGPASLRIWL